MQTDKVIGREVNSKLAFRSIETDGPSYLLSSAAAPGGNEKRGIAA